MTDEQRMIATIKKVMPAVVSIAAERHLKDLKRDMPHELYSFLPGRAGAKKRSLRIADILSDARGMVDVGGGSGFIVSPDGLILTNKHVVADAKAEYTVILSDGRKLPAQVLSRDPVNDVAILKVTNGKLPAVALAKSNRLDLGTQVIAIGNALGIFKNTVSAGIVSGLSRAIDAKEDDQHAPHELRGLIQTDAAINPGNSGGPLVNLSGEAVGVNTAMVSNAENISFAIPISAARRDLADLKRYGRIRRPTMGLRYLVIDERLAERMKLSARYGALVVPESPHDPGVVPGGPADRAGIREGDIVLTINGTKITPDHTIQDALENLAAGAVATLTVARSGKERTVRATLAERK